MVSLCWPMDYILLTTHSSFHSTIYLSICLPIYLNSSINLYINLPTYPCSYLPFPQSSHHTCLAEISSDRVLDDDRTLMAVSSSRMLPSDDERISRILSSISLSCFLLKAPSTISWFFFSSSSGFSLAATSSPAVGPGDPAGGDHEVHQGNLQGREIRGHAGLDWIALRLHRAVMVAHDFMRRQYSQAFALSLATLLN